jgi:hypothetical protein
MWYLAGYLRECVMGSRPTVRSSFGILMIIMVSTAWEGVCFFFQA